MSMHYQSPTVRNKIYCHKAIVTDALENSTLAMYMAMRESSIAQELFDIHVWSRRGSNVNWMAEDIRSFYDRKSELLTKDMIDELIVHLTALHEVMMELYRSGDIASVSDWLIDSVRRLRKLLIKHKDDGRLTTAGSAMTHVPAMGDR